MKLGRIKLKDPVDKLYTLNPKQGQTLRLHVSI